MNSNLLNNNLENFNRLKEEQENFLVSCDERIEKWLKFREDYVSLRNRLETLPDQLKYEITVPISKFAFMPGKLVHTNEILVLLGDNWFVEKSAKQACELIDRRLRNIDHHLDELNQEKNKFSDQLKWTKNLIEEKNEFVNIEEKFEENALNSKPKASKSNQLSEEEKKELRRKQQEKALQLQAEIDKEIKSSFDRAKSASKHTKHEEEEEEESEISDNDEKPSQKADFMQQLEKDLKDLDVQENNFNEIDYNESKEELKEMFAEYEKNINRENNQMIEEKLKNRVKVIKSERKSVKFAENVEEKENFGPLHGYDQGDEEEEETESDYDEDEDSDDYEEEPAVSNIRAPHTIRIKHTKSVELDEKEHNLKISREKAAINSPADIYSCFYKPKSILKPSSSSDMNIPFKIEEEKEALVERREPKNAEDEKFEPLKAFSGEIIERNPLTKEQQVELNKNKPVSKFKASKLKN